VHTLWLPYPMQIGLVLKPPANHGRRIACRRVHPNGYPTRSIAFIRGAVKWRRGRHLASDHDLGKHETVNHEGNPRVQCTARFQQSAAG